VVAIADEFMQVVCNKRLLAASRVSIAFTIQFYVCTYATKIEDAMS
jgi:hypothetical protein